jgi:uroporphyrinogen-III synthase
MITLLEDHTSSSNGTAVALRNPNNRDYRTYTVYATGNFDGATVKLQISLDNINWVDVTSFTSAGAVLAEFRASYARGVVSSAGASTSLTLRMG